jgi:hypothetical protein
MDRASAPTIENNKQVISWRGYNITEWLMLRRADRNFSRAAYLAASEASSELKNGCQH